MGPWDEILLHLSTSLGNVILFVFDRLYTGTLHGIIGTALLQSPIFKDVVRNNVNLNSTFNQIDKSISKTMTEPNTALLFDESYVKNKMMENDCKFKVGYNANCSTNIIIYSCLIFQLVQIWKSLTPIYAESIALKKNSTYTIFFKKGILDLMGNGVLDLYKQRNNNLNQNCNQHAQNIHALGYLKTASHFIILLSGTILSFSILIYECLKSPKNIATEEMKLKQYQMEICHTIDATDLLSEEKRELLKKDISILVENIHKTDVF